MIVRQVKTNEPFSVTLKGDQSTGYVWKNTSDCGLRNISTGVMTDNAEGSPGTSVNFTFWFVAEEPGRYSLKLILVRPWERTSVPIATHEEEIFVS